MPEVCAGEPMIHDFVTRAQRRPGFIIGIPSEKHQTWSRYDIHKIT